MLINILFCDTQPVNFFFFYIWSNLDYVNSFFQIWDSHSTIIQQ